MLPISPVTQGSHVFHRPACDMEPCRECENECDASDTRSRSGTAARLKLPLRLHSQAHEWLSCTALLSTFVFERIIHMVVQAAALLS